MAVLTVNYFGRSGAADSSPDGSSAANSGCKATGIVV